MKPRIVERTKRCNGCGQVKPWSEFNAFSKWPDGTMRTPKWQCKKCMAKLQREWRKRNPDKARAAQKRWRDKMAKDAAWREHRRESARMNYAARRMAEGHTYRPQRPIEYLPTLGGGRRLHIGPLRAYLLDSLDRRKWDRADLAAALVGEAMTLVSAKRAIYRWLEDPRTVEVREGTVDWVLTRLDEPHRMYELYPELATKEAA